MNNKEVLKLRLESYDFNLLEDFLYPVCDLVLDVKSFLTRFLTLSTSDLLNSFLRTLSFIP